MLFLLLTLLTPPSFAKEPALPKDVKWTLHVVKGEDVKNLQKFEIGKEAKEIKLEGTDWTCTTMADPQGNAAKMAVVCKLGTHFMVLPMICYPGVVELSTLTLGTREHIYSVQLLCDAPKPEKKKAEKAKKEEKKP